MALRLTNHTTPSDASAATPTAPTTSAAALGLQARWLMSTGDLTGFAGVLAEAGQIDDPQRRYHARVSVLEQGLVAAGEATNAVAARAFAAVADAALTLLDEQPSEPVVLNCAGVACYELWILDAAQALFKAAKRLDPGLTHIARNLDELGRRKRLGGRPTRPLHASAPGLARRAKAIAARAQPATGLTISLCMIVRNEEQMLGRCLAAAAPAVDEMVIVDTGSDDATVEIARSFGAHVIEFPWTGSFSEARNVSFAAATGDWLFYLDADEILADEDGDRLRSLAGHTWREAFYLVETSYIGELGEGSAFTSNALRIFRNRPEYRFSGRLHEQIVQTLPTYAPGRIEQTAVRLQHYGYLGSIRASKEKSRRNIDLLREQMAESAPSPFLHFNLGSEYAAAGEPAPAAREFRRALSMLEADGSLQACDYAPLLIVRLVSVLRSGGQMIEARETAARGLKLFGDLTDLVYAQAATALALGDVDEATTLYRRCMDLGDAPARYGAMVGSGTFLPRMVLAELHLAQGDTAQARELLSWCAEHHPDFVGIAGPYATALLRDGVAPADAVAEVERLDTITPTARTAIAAALQHAGAPEAAERQYRAVLAATPSSTKVRVALGEILLGRGSWDEAAQHAAATPDDDPYAGLACRIELCALTGRGDPAAGRAALERANRVGLPPAELEVFAAWTAIADGSPAPSGLPVAGVPVLGVILDTLLRARDLERFEALLPALRQSRLAPREQRHLLGDIFLAQGMGAAAAREWMAICADAPDARALVGLARVAVAHGMPADAANFATGALELEPDCDPARELLAQLSTGGVALRPPA